MLVVAMLPPLSPVSMLATPSMVMLFEFGRCPLTVKPLTEPISWPPVPWGTAPGTSTGEVEELRPLLAMLVSAAFSSANERSPLVVCSSLTRLETVTSSVIAPTSSVRMPASTGGRWR